MLRINNLTASLAVVFMLTTTAQAGTPPGGRQTLEQRLNELEQQVGQLKAELNDERMARQKVESTAVIRPVSDGKSLKFQSPNADFSFQADGRAAACMPVSNLPSPVYQRFPS